MDLQSRISSFKSLSAFLDCVANQKEDKVEKVLKKKYFEALELIQNLHFKNGWFIEDFVKFQLNSIAFACSGDKLDNWLAPYISKIIQKISKKVAVIMAGNIPFVGFHDFISVLITGNELIMKLSSKDEDLPKFIIDVLIDIEPEFKQKIFIVEDKLKDFEAVIATGSNNTSRYFKYYFSKVPNIIRHSRNSIAILDGKETNEELEKLADDIFLYFGLGCRNISKIFVPENYNFDSLFQAVYKYKHLADVTKYANNYEYNRAIYLMERIKFLDNGFFMLKNDFSLFSPVAVLHYESYSDISDVEKYIKSNNDNLQCIVSRNKNIAENVLDFGKTQLPELIDYEDNVNILDFLISIR